MALLEEGERCQCPACSAGHSSSLRPLLAHHLSHPPHKTTPQVASSELRAENSPDGCLSASSLGVCYHCMPLTVRMVSPWERRMSSSWAEQDEMALQAWCIVLGLLQASNCFQPMRCACTSLHYHVSSKHFRSSPTCVSHQSRHWLSSCQRQRILKMNKKESLK